jgi:hypothetical protein
MHHFNKAEDELSRSVLGVICCIFEKGYEVLLL